MVQGLLCVSGFDHTETKKVTLDSLQAGSDLWAD